jgi:hypothetical protein
MITLPRLSAISKPGWRMLPRKAQRTDRALLIGGLLLVSCLPSLAVADGIIETCTNLAGTGFTASGGIAKPGWSPIAPEVKHQVKLAITNGKWDIIRTGADSRRSALADGCSVNMFSNATMPLDMMFVVACEDQVETVLFYVRDGQSKLITTTMSRRPGSAGAAITETSDCHNGD